MLPRNRSTFISTSSGSMPARMASFVGTLPSLRSIRFPVLLLFSLFFFSIGCGKYLSTIFFVNACLENNENFCWPQFDTTFLFLSLILQIQLLPPTNDIDSLSGWIHHHLLFVLKKEGASNELFKKSSCHNHRCRVYGTAD